MLQMKKLEHNEHCCPLILNQGNEGNYKIIKNGKAIIIFNSIQQICIECPIWTFMNIVNDLFEQRTESKTNLMCSFNDSSLNFLSKT